MVAISALEALLQTEQRNISTGSAEMDRLLGGGIQLGTVTEICGMAGLGKTQLSMQLCATVQSLGNQVKSVYIDTEGSFIPRRMQQIAQGFMDRTQSDQDWQHILNQIDYLRVHTLPELLAAIHVVDQALQTEPIQLVIIDSIAFHFRSITNFQERTRILNTLAQTFRKWASQHQIAVVLTNQMTTKIGDTRFSSMSRTMMVPALGESWGHACTHRLILLWRNERRSAWLCKSATTEEGIVSFDITVSWTHVATGNRIDLTCFHVNDSVHESRTFADLVQIKVFIGLYLFTRSLFPSWKSSPPL
jgi:RAD51-like protein 2